MLEILKQRSTWVGFSGIATGIFMLVNKHYDAGVQTIIGGLAIIFLREAINKSKE